MSKRCLTDAETTRHGDEKRNARVKVAEDRTTWKNKSKCDRSSMVFQYSKLLLYKALDEAHAENERNQFVHPDNFVAKVPAHDCPGYDEPKVDDDCDTIKRITCVHVAREKSVNILERNITFYLYRIMVACRDDEVVHG